MRNTRNNLMIALKACVTLLCAVFFVVPASGQAPNRPANRSQAQGGRARFAFSWRLAPGTSIVAPSGVTPAGGPILPVIGGGTFGRITKWTGFGTNSVIGDSTIFEDKLGNVGIGTDSPTSKLTVAGNLTVAGTIQASGGSSVLRDSTLTGEGTSSSPLGVAIPLELTAVAGEQFILRIQNNGESGAGLDVAGGNSSILRGGSGIRVFAGFGTRGGDGIDAHGGTGATSFGGDGVIATGGAGNGAGRAGGAGIIAIFGTGENGANNGLAGDFVGDVHVSGNLSKGGGSFKIDHPLDPENKYLYHSFVESPDMKNIYDGVAKLDSRGEATVQLPDWFGALNRDFRYLLTAIGVPSPALYIAEEITDNHFKIAGGTPGMKVSWQVTGIRQDAYANRHRIPVEEAKPEAERGSYLHPDSFDQPEEKNVLFVQHPQLIKHVREFRQKLQ